VRLQHLLYAGFRAWSGVLRELDNDGGFADRSGLRPADRGFLREFTVKVREQSL